MSDNSFLQRCLDSIDAIQTILSHPKYEELDEIYDDYVSVHFSPRLPEK